MEGGISLFRENLAHGRRPLAEKKDAGSREKQASERAVCRAAARR